MLTDFDVSRQDTTLIKLAYLAQMPMDAQPGRRAWVRKSLELRVADRRRDRDLVADIAKHRHYLGRWPAKPKTLVLSYLGDLRGVTPGEAGAAVCAMVTLQPSQYHIMPLFDLHQCEVLNLSRCWRADDLGPAMTPDLMPETLRRIVKGGRGVASLRDEWIARKLREGGLRAIPRVLATYADPAQGHDGALYSAAGALDCGCGSGGKRLFAWGLDEAMTANLRALAAGVQERAALMLAEMR